MSDDRTSTAERSAPQRQIKLDAPTYHFRRYLTLPRIITHWHQANEVVSAVAAGGHVLEIGPGTGHTTWMLRHAGLEVTTIDLDVEAKPTAAADVTRLPFGPGSFDCVLAAEVLEHLPFEEFGNALGELKRVSRGSLVVTLPAPFIGVSALLNMPVVEPRGVSIGVPYARRHRPDGVHFWELGKRGYGVRRIRARIAEQGLEIVREFRPAPSLYCYFFVLRAIAGR